LQGLDVTLESLLLQLMVCFECEDLVVGFLGETLARVGSRVEFLGIVTHQVDVTDDVLVGTKTRTPSDGITDTIKYDISVDSQTSPTIFSTPYRWGAIPRYIVAFYQGT
jgi:hypothetical protein